MRVHWHPREQEEDDARNSVLLEMTGVGWEAQKYGRGPLVFFSLLKNLAHPIAWAVRKQTHRFRCYLVEADARQVALVTTCATRAAWRFFLFYIFKQ